MKINLDVPEGKSGIWSVENFVVGPKAAQIEKTYALLHGGRGVPEGSYTRLKRNGEVIMSNTPDEIRDHVSFMYTAKGHVLINGLGLGVVIEMIIGSIDQITIIEKSEDVINLVANHYLNKYPRKIEIINEDAFEYISPKGIHYDAVWHDIWDAICTDNLKEMEKLHRKYGHKTDWQGSWGKEICQYYKRSGY